MGRRVRFKRVFWLSIVFILLSVVILGIYDTTHPRRWDVLGKLTKADDMSYAQIKKISNNGRFYIFLSGFVRGKMITIKLSCTRVQYEYINDDQANYHIAYDLNFFNRHEGCVVKVDNKGLPDYSQDIPKYNFTH